MNPLTGKLRSTEAVRVGDPESIVKPGDPVPGKPGHYYEAGQYAPSPERLSALKLQETVRAGLLTTVLEDEKLSKLFTKQGEVNTDYLKKFDPTPWLVAYGFKEVDESLPKFASIGLISVLLLIPREHTLYARFKKLTWIANIQVPEEDFIAQKEQFSKAINLSDRNVITGTRRTDEGNAELVLFQPYFVYMSVPVLPGIPGISNGLSIATVATLKSIGREIYRSIRRRNKRMFFRFLDVFGWKKEDELTSEEVIGYLPAGSELGLKRKTGWYRNIGKPFLSTNSVISPKESFAEAYVYYWTHRQYMEKVFPNALEFFTDLESYINDTVGAE